MAANFYLTMNLGDERHQIVAADGGTLVGSEAVLVVVDDFTWQNQRTAGGSPEAAEDAPAPRQAPRSAAPAPTAGLEDDVPF